MLSRNGYTGLPWEETRKGYYQLLTPFVRFFFTILIAERATSSPSEGEPPSGIERSLLYNKFYITSIPTIRKAVVSANTDWAGFLRKR